MGVESRNSCIPAGRQFSAQSACELFVQVATSAELEDFLTLPAYERLVASA